MASSGDPAAAVKSRDELDGLARHRGEPVPHEGEIVRARQAFQGGERRGERVRVRGQRLRQLPASGG